MSNTTLEIIQGLSQAAANAYDGAHDKRFSYDGEELSMGLKREEGCPINDSRVMDGFNVRFYGDSMILSYQSDILLKEVYTGRFEQDIESISIDNSNFCNKYMGEMAFIRTLSSFFALILSVVITYKVW